MYQTGFGNYHQSEAKEGALPSNQNSPQKCALGLFAEQLNGSAFTSTKQNNLHTWLYRAHPSVIYNNYTIYESSPTKQFALSQTPNPLRWSPLSILGYKQDFIDGLHHIAGNSAAHTYIYQCNNSMSKRYFSNRDGELLFVPYDGKIKLNTELGALEVEPGMIAVIPRGITFNVDLIDKYAAGYLCENLHSPLTLPELGIIGANGLANPRHFNYPIAAFEEIKDEFQIICKYQNNWWQMSSLHSPLNVVAWHGNYAPYSYNLSLFNTINTVSFDHPDPSIFTVLTSPSNISGVANLDFVIFPERWMVAEHTFRPPYFHRNIMSEFMGLIDGCYDAKKEGFHKGGISIHNCMTPHGPDTLTFQTDSEKKLKAEKQNKTLAFMFESNKPWLVTDDAMNRKERQKNYASCWDGL